MAETAEAYDADLGVRPDVPVTEWAVRGDAGAEQGCDGGELRLERAGDGMDVALMDDDVVGVAAESRGAVVVFSIVGADEAFGAVALFVGRAVFAEAAGVDHDADPGQIARSEFTHLVADSSDVADDLVAGNHGIGGLAPLVADLMYVGVTDAAVGDFDEDVVGAGVAALKLVRGEACTLGLCGVSLGLDHVISRCELGGWMRRLGLGACLSLFVIVQEAENVVLPELGSAFEEVEFDGEADAGDFAAELANELDGGLHGAAGGEEIVDDNDALAGLDGVEVDFEGVGAVFQVVVDAGDGGGELFGLADGDEARVEAVGERRAEDETAGLNAEDEVDLAADVVGGEGVDELGEAGFVAEEGGDVVEEDAGPGKVGDGADEALEGLAVEGGSVRVEVHYHAPSIWNGPRASASESSRGCSRIWSTRLPREPLRRARRSSARSSGSPAATTSTWPSSVFLTQPRRLSSAASRWTNQRKPTPWTRPRMRKWWTGIRFVSQVYRHVLEERVSCK